MSRLSNLGRPKLGPDAKLVMLASLAVSSVVVDSLVALLALLGSACCALLLARVGWRRVLIWLGASALTLWGFVLSQSIFYPYRPRTMLLEIIPASAPFIGWLTGGVALYFEGALYGALQSLRLLAVITAGLAVVWTTSPSELLCGLRTLGLPHGFAFMVATAVRFLPEIAAEAGAVLTAMRARGYRLGPTHPWRTFRAVAASLPPVLYRNMRRAAMLADSLECRGFSAGGRTGAAAAGPRRSLSNPVVLAAVPTIVVLLLTAKVLLLAAHTGILYVDSLGWLYGFVEKVL